MSEYPWCPNIHDVRISVMSKYPWCPNIHDFQIPVYPNIHDVRLSMMSDFPWCPNIHDVWISMISKYPWHLIPMKAKKSHFLGSLIFREVNFPGKSNFTKDVHDVHISAIYDTQLRLMTQVMTYVDARRTDGRKRRVICSCRPDSFAAGKNLCVCV